MEHTAAKKKPKRRIITWIIIACVVLFLLAANVPIPVNRTVPALEICVLDLDHVIERTVTINGRWHFDPFALGRNHRFEGRIEISGYPETFNELAYPMEMRRLRQRPFRYITSVWYRDDLYHPYGIRTERLYTGMLFHQAFFDIIEWGERIEHEDGSSGRHGTSGMGTPFIVLNATTRDQAIRIVNRHFIRALGIR